MSSATKNLENDHSYILRLLDVIDRMADNAISDADDLEMIVYLIRNYADGFHHAKEENIFFPALEMKGLSPYHGPVAVMLAEHTQGRNFVTAMAGSIEQLRAGDTGALTTAYQNMKGYTNLLRNHIAKENNILFRMADNIITEEEQAKILSQFDTVVSETIKESGDEKKFIAEIELLEKKYQS